jgi:tRNA(fMet)-specific endonuclease VapC
LALLVDSSVLIGLERRRLHLDSLPSAVPDEPIAIAAISVSELLIGAHRADTSERRARRMAFAESIVAAIPVLPFDLNAAIIHADIHAQLTRGGSQIGAHDLLIAATALAHDFDLLTENLRELVESPISS